MRKTNWLFLLMFGSVGVTLASGVALANLLLHPPPAPVRLPPHADARTYAQIAVDLAEQRRYDDAIAVNTRALGYDAGEPALLYNQAWLAARLGRWAQALVYLDQGLSRTPADGEMRYLRAWVLEKLGRQPEAAAALQAANRLGWQPADAYAAGRLLQLQQRHAEAIKAFARALEVQPNQPVEFWFWRARSERATNQLQAALADLDTAVALKPSAALYRARADLKQALGQTAAALQDLAVAQQLAPSRESRLAGIRLQLELDSAAAQAAATELLKDQPDWPPAQRLQVRALLANRQTKPAQRALDAYLRQHPADAEALGLQAMLYRLQRKYLPAEAALTQAEKAGYDPADAQLERARLAILQGHQAEALTALRQALQLQPALKSQLKADRQLRRVAKAL